MKADPESRKTVLVVGAGGNIGSHLVPHLARMAEVGRAVLVDKDRYEESNMASQDIDRRDLGKSKAQVAARRIRSIAPDKEVVAIADDVRNVPLGRLRADVVVACLDSREARRVVNTIAWRLGMPYVDTGVRGEDLLLARVNVYLPGKGNGCLECAWDEKDYDRATLEQPHPCTKAGPAPTNAPSALGALAGALGAIECQKLLSGRAEAAAVGRQVLVDALHHNHYVTVYPPNPDCRFDHATWRNVERLARDPGSITLAEAFALRERKVRGNGSPALAVEGQAFVRQVQCLGCGGVKPCLRLQGRLRRSERVCARCGGELAAAGSGLAWSLKAEELRERMLQWPLCRAGFRRGDVFTLSGGGRCARFEIDCGGV